MTLEMILVVLGILTISGGAMTWIVRRGDASDVRHTQNDRRLFDGLDELREENNRQHGEATRERHAMELRLLARIGEMAEVLARVEGTLATEARLRQILADGERATR